MRRLPAALLVAFASCAAQAQTIEGQPIASQYGGWKVSGFAPNTYSFAPSSCRVQGGSSFFPAFTVGTPVRIVDGNPALSETVTPTAVTIDNVTCSITIAPVNQHNLPFYLTSATAGLQEALNANTTNPQPNTIVLNNDFYQLAGSSSAAAAIIASVQGQPQIGLVDITQVPTVWYQWNASQYVAVGGSVGGVGAFSQWQEGYGPNAGTSAFVGPVSNEYTLPLGQTGSTITSLLSTSGNAVRIQPGDARTQFSNPNYNPVHDDRTLIPAKAWDVTASGAACDAGMIEGTLTAGSTTLTASGTSFTTADTGKWIESVGTVAGVVTRFDATVTYASPTTLTLSVPAPFSSVANSYILFGHQDDAALKSAIALGISTGREIDLPQGTCWSATPLRLGANLVGHGISWSQYTNSEGVIVRPGSNVAGSAGEDVFALMDPSQSGYSPAPSGFTTHDYSILLDPTIDATQPWQICTNGTCVAQTPLYRPGGILDANAPDPMAPQWCQGTGAYKTGCLNGVATVANASTLACIPTSETLPAVGSEILFPGYAAGTANFETTVASQGTSGCATGNNGITLSAAFVPATPAAPVEWFAGTSLQTIQTAIPATGRTFPMTVTLGNPILPIPSTTQYASPAGFGSWGLVQIDGEQCSFYGNSNIPASTTAAPSITLTACAQNGTAAAAHSIGAFIAPLNPLQPTWPWPVTPTLTSNQTTPANAEFFPSFGAGNAGIAAPVANGNGLSGFQTSFYDSKMYNIQIGIDWINGAAGNPVNWNTMNDTAGMYLAQIPFRSTFRDISIADTYYGIVEGSPATNTAGWNTLGTYPTANGNTWDSIFLNSSAIDMHIVSDQGGGFKQLAMFSQSAAAPNNTYPGYTNAYSGGIESIFLDTPYDDESAVFPYAAVSVALDTFDFRYEEVENGALTQKAILDQWNCDRCSWYDTAPEGNGVRVIGGRQQNFDGGSFGGGPTLPLINTGWNNAFKNVAQLGVGTAAGNVWGQSNFLNWGPETQAAGPGYLAFGNPTGPSMAQATQNNIVRAAGQTVETLVGGNTLYPYLNSSAGLFTADEFTTNKSWEPSPWSQGWTYDATEPLVGGYAGCNVGVTTGSTYCADKLPDLTGFWIGPGQRLSADQYVVTMEVKESAGPAQNFAFQFYAGPQAPLTGCATSGDVISQTVPVTTTWTVVTLGVVNLAAYNNCGGQFNIGYASSAATQIQVAAIDFAPVDANRTVNDLTVLNSITLPPGNNGSQTTGCSKSPVTGIDNGYTCPTTGWYNALNANQAATDTTITLLNAPAGYASSGCFFLDSEYECYTGISGSTLTGLKRGQYNTAAVAHTSGTPITSVNLVLGGLQAPATDVVVGGASAPPILGVNNSTPTNHNGISVLSINSGASETWFDTSGAIHQTQPSALNVFQAPVQTYGSMQIGTSYGPPISSSGQVLQTNGQNQATQPIGFGGGIAGSVDILPTQNIAAPALTNYAGSGSTARSYLCSGVDTDGNAIPGATATLSNTPASFAYPQFIVVNCPYTAGVSSYTVWRTAGGPSQGYLATNVAMGANVYDYDGAATAGTPPSSNGSNPHLTVNGTGTPSISLNGVSWSTGSSAPSGSCASGSLYSNTSGSPNTLYVCQASAWVGK